MNAMAWIAIAAIIIPNAIKGCELYLIHKEQASPNDTENLRVTESQVGKIEKKLRRVRKIGTVASVGFILLGLTDLALNMANTSRINPRSLMVTAIVQTAGIMVCAWALYSFLKPKH